MDFELKLRSSNWLMRALNKLGGGAYWTTIGKTIYYPDQIVDPHLFPDIIEHEKVHVAQYKKLSVPVFLFLYCLVPLPVGLAYFRWRFEREAYLVQFKYLLAENPQYDIDFEVEQVVRSLWFNYLFAWPRGWMKSWFLKRLSK